MRESAGRWLLARCLLALFSPMLCWSQLPYAMFMDVPSGATYYNQANLLGERMITHGCTVVPHNYCPGWNLTRGQAAVLIIRSIFSGRSGDPDTFPYEQSPFFTDVQPGHPQFPWIQKMKELGITSGCTTTTYCPDGNLSFSQLAVFTHRGRQLRFNQALTPPPQCSSGILGDVPQNHMFCGYIQSIYYEYQLFDTAKSPYCYTGFCPDNLPVDRGTSAFYLVTGILAATSPQSLPNSSGQLPPVSLVTVPDIVADCQRGDYYGDYYYANHIEVIGQSLRAWAQTGVINPSNPAVWDNYVALDFWQSGTWPPLYSQAYSTGSGLDHAYLQSGYSLANSSYNYSSDSRHQVTSFCITGGVTSLQTKNDPMILSANTTVLYRGTTQAITFQGSSLAQVQGVESNPLALGGSALSSQQFQSTLNVTTPFNATAGNIGVRLSAVAPVPQVQNGFVPTTGESHKTNYLTMTVADPTPAVSSMLPNSGTQGQTNLPVTLTAYAGNNFGQNPKVCIVQGANCVEVTTDISISTPSCLSPCTSVTAVFTIGNNAALGTYTIAVESRGAMGNGFASGGGVSTARSAGVGFQVQAAVPPTVRLQSLLFDPLGTAPPGSPAHFVNSYRATGADYTSEADISKPLNNLVYEDQTLAGNPSIAPAVFRLFDNQSVPVSRRPKLSFVILKTVGSTNSFNTTLRIESSNPKLQFPDVAISFSNGEGRVQGLAALADYSSIDNYSTTLTLKLLSNPQVVIASFILPVYILYDVPRIFPELEVAPNLIIPSASQSITDKRIALATLLAAGTQTAPNLSDTIVEDVHDRFPFGSGSIGGHSNNAWLLYSRPGSPSDCISYALVAGSILNMAGRSDRRQLFISDNRWRRVISGRPIPGWRTAILAFLSAKFL